MELYRDASEVEPGQLEFRRNDETLNEYAQRLFNDTLKPRELELFNKHPEMLLAIHLKIMNRNTKWEPGQRDALETGLTKLGLMDEQGKIILQDCEDDACINRKTAMVFQEATGLDIAYEEGETIDQFFSRAVQSNLSEEQKQTLRLLVFFNVMAKKNVVELKEQGVETHDISNQSLDLDDVEANMGVRSEVCYGNSGSALSDYERARLGAILLEEMETTDAATENDSEQAIDDRRANAFRARFKMEVQKQWGKPWFLMTSPINNFVKLP